MRIKKIFLYFIWFFFLSLQIEIAGVGVAYSQNANLTVPADLHTETIILTPTTQPCVCDASNPAAEGKIYYNTTDDRFRYCDGKQWGVFGIDVTVGTRIVAAWNSHGSVIKGTNNPCSGKGNDNCYNPAADYTCNGSANPDGGSGDQDILSQAVSNLTGKPGTIYLMAGTYNITNPSSLTLGNNQSLIGSGRGTVLRWTREMDQNFLSLWGSGITVSQLTLDASDPNIVHTGLITGGGISLYNVNDSRIDKVWFVATRNAIMGSNVFNTTISNCDFKNVQISKLRFANSSYNTFSHNHMLGGYSYGFGFTLINCTSNIISYNSLGAGANQAKIAIQGGAYNTVIYNNLYGAVDSGIDIAQDYLGCCEEPVPETTPHNNIIAFNNIQGVSTGIDVGAGYADTIAGNLMFNTRGNGIEMWGPFCQLISANMAIDSGLLDTSADGFFMNVLTSSILSANLASDSSGTGYGIDLYQGDNDISGNEVVDTGGYTGRPIIEHDNHHGSFTDKARWTFEPDHLKTAYDPGSGAMLSPASSHVNFMTGSTYAISGINTAGRVPGDILIITNEFPGAITIPSGGSSNIILAGGGSRVLGQHDTLSLIYNGSVWLEMGESDNN